MDTQFSYSFSVYLRNANAPKIISIFSFTPVNFIIFFCYSRVIEKRNEKIIAYIKSRGFFFGDKSIYKNLTWYQIYQIKK